MTMQTLTFYGIVCLIFITGIASADDENRYQTSQCATPKTYDTSVEVKNNSLNVVSTVLIDFSCTEQYNIILYIKHFCDIQKIDVRTDISYTVMKDAFHWKTILEPSSTNQLKSVSISLNKNETRFVEEQKIPLEPGLYTIDTTYNCSLEKVAAVFSYVNQSEEKGLVFVSRTPSEWIFPYWENPATKARFIIRIKHKEDERALSNMDISFFRRERLDTIFDTTSLISTHLVTVVVVPHVYMNSESFVIIYDNEKSELYQRFYGRQQLVYSYADHYFCNSRRIGYKLKDIISPSIVTCLILPVNFTNYKSVVTKGLVIFSEDDVVFDHESHTHVRKEQIRSLVTRSMLQEMFSDWIVTFRKSDPWLVEGFLTFVEVYITEQYHNISLMKPIVDQTHHFLDQWREKDKAM